MNWFNKNRCLFFILVLVFVVHLIFLPGFHEIWWDSGVYAGMGKHIFSAGQSGLWEHIRPPVLPFLLGLLWLVKLDMLFFGRILQLFFALGCVLFFYLVAKHYFKKKTAILSTSIFAFSSIMLYLSFHVYSEIPALFFVLVSMYFFTRRFFCLAGIFSGVAFLTKFPAGIFLVVLALTLLLDKKFKRLLRLSAGFAIPVIPVLAAYQFFYGDFSLPFIDAHHTILSVLGCNVLRYQPWWHYLRLIVKENFLHLFAVAGVVSYFMCFKKSKIMPFLAFLLPLIYFSQLQCRDYRYLALFIPFVALFSGIGINCITKKSEKLFQIFLFAILGISIFSGALFYISNENTNYDPASMNYFRYLENQSVSGEVWSANPLVSIFTDTRINKIYYPVYDKGLSVEFSEYIANNKEKIEYVFLDNCGGGIICPPGDTGCENQTSKMIDFLKDNFEKAYDRKKGNCGYLVFKN